MSYIFENIFFGSTSRIEIATAAFGPSFCLGPQDITCFVDSAKVVDGAIFPLVHCMFHVNGVASGGIPSTSFVLKRSVAKCGVLWKSKMLIQLVAKLYFRETAAETSENNNTSNLHPEKCSHSTVFGRMLRRGSGSSNAFYSVNG